MQLLPQYQTSLFGTVITIAFESVFHMKMHQNNFFKKIIFNINTSK
jgi:hypothetical protein